MKILLDQLEIDRPTNDELKKLGGKLNFYNGLPECRATFAIWTRALLYTCPLRRPSDEF